MSNSAISSECHDALEWLSSQPSSMLNLLQDLCNQNSGTFNSAGVSVVAERLHHEYAGHGNAAPVGDWVKLQPTPPAEILNDQGLIDSFALGPTLRAEARPTAKQQVFLCIHTDTVYEVGHPFQKCRFVGNGQLNGPGVIDAKGGLVVLLFALRAFERSSLSKRLGWKVVLNPDEEIGSLGSHPILKEVSQQCQFGLLFEPVMPDGAMVSSRKGSGNFTLVCHGRSAHAGRNFSAGRNAIVHLSRCLVELDSLNQTVSGDSTINVGRIHGGGAVNVVPDFAMARLNVRGGNPEQIEEILTRINDVVIKYSMDSDYRLSLTGQVTSPPKVLDAASHRIQERIEMTGHQVGVPIHWRPSGGASDGNKLSGWGIPNIDTLGPVGDHLHSPDEYLVIDSLLQRTRLATALLFNFASEPFLRL
ncbi:MAG: hydrolase [Planctomycetaceae bacterium]|nr:hydrolase [Planctomycetaceae bacterium]